MFLQYSIYPEDEISVARKGENYHPGVQNTPFNIQLRIPGWAKGSKVYINGKEADIEMEPGHFAFLHRKWEKGDVILLEMPMEIKLMEGHPYNEELQQSESYSTRPGCLLHRISGFT